MYVHAWEEEMGFPMGLGENWSSRLRKGAWIKALRASNSTNACFWNFVQSDVCPAHSFKSNPFSLAYQNQLYRQIPAFGRPCTRDFPRTSGCFRKNHFMKIAESPFVAQQEDWMNHTLHLETAVVFWFHHFLCAPMCFSLRKVGSIYQLFFNTTAGWEWFSTINPKMSSPEDSEEFCREAGVKQYIGYWLLVEMWEQRGLSAGCLKPQCSHSKLHFY